MKIIMLNSAMSPLQYFCLLKKRQDLESMDRLLIKIVLVGNVVMDMDTVTLKSIGTIRTIVTVMAKETKVL